MLQQGPPFLEIMFHLPHDRFAIGWDWMRADDEYDYTTFKLYLLLVTLTFNI